MKYDYSMAALHSIRDVGEDLIFKTNNEAKLAAQKIGNENIVNSSVGTLLKDDGNLAVIPTVINILRGLPDEEFCSYAPIAGLPDFLQNAKKATFRNSVPDGFIEAVATPGGTGAIRHAIWNYTDFGDTVLTADWYWGPYKNIAEEHGRKIDTFKLFDEQNNFNIASFKEKVNELLDKKNRLLMLMNFPANNPTGYSLSEDEWDEVIEFLKFKSSKADSRIIMFLDVAYIDYAGDEEETRKFFKKFENLPQNILTIVAFSMSKGYTLYGMRCGAMIGLSSKSEIANEFRRVNEFSNRAVWSNGTRPAMTVLTRIMSDRDIFEQVGKERAMLRNTLDSRAKAFLKEADRVNLNTCTYKAGFFISIPCSNPKEVAEKLKEDYIYSVPLSKGIRFAICSVSESKCIIAPAKFAKIIK